MEKNQAKNLIKQTFNQKFDKDIFREFIINLLDGINEQKAFCVGNAQVKEAFQKYICSYKRVGQYTDKNSNVIDVLVVHLNDKCSLDRNRTMLRNFVADYMKTRQKENTLVAFYNDTNADWRFSFVKLDMSLKQDESGKVKVVNEFTSAKRFSFLVGELEPNHTAQSRLVSLLEKDYPTLGEIEEAFNVEKVSKEFFANYKELFLRLVDDLKEIRKNDERINYEFTLKSIKEADFCKKLLGQLVFLYFIQKKGWLGVPVDKKWGEGDKQFLRHTFEKAVQEGKNFFNDYLEHLFYNALANGERDNNYFSLLNCKIPFLNGGLFETIGGYSWTETDIIFDNKIFSNNEKTKNGDVGTGILDVFDRYNFTVKEDEPLEKEVAVDPEMLGKVFEELLDVEDRKSKGAFYTPREIVHYMCQESLINYLATELGAIEDETEIKSLAPCGRGQGEGCFENEALLSTCHSEALAEESQGLNNAQQSKVIANESETNCSNCHSELVSESDQNVEKISSSPVGESNQLTKQAIADFIHHSDKLSQVEFVATERETQNVRGNRQGDGGKKNLAPCENLQVEDIVERTLAPCGRGQGEGYKTTKYTHKIHPSIINNAERIDKALENIKICDPAIGSGAFPVGMLNEIVRARIALVESGFLKETKKRSVYEYKRQAIQNSIYGVDIEAGAVEIAKLRLWLSLVVDEEDIENIKALPNLDYKIVQGNSLLDLYNVIIPSNLQESFNNYSNLLFDESNKQKKKSYQNKLNEIKNDVFKTAQALGCDATFDFHFFFHEVFKNGGFDIIIANPPYVGEKGHKELFEPIKKCSLKKFYLGKMDLFYFFFHLALNILKPNGCCAFITTNYYITALGARLLRQDFKERAILKELINFNELKIFESALGQHNLITMFQKGYDKDKKCNLINVNKKGFLDNTFDNIVTGKDTGTTYNNIPQTELYDGEENYIRLAKEDKNSTLSVILNKIKSNNDVLGNICNVNQGIVTGADKVTEKHIRDYSLKEPKGTGIFVLSNQEINDNPQLEQEFIKPMFKNSDIRRYYSSSKTNENLLYFAKNVSKDYILKIIEYLEPYKKLLSSRREVEKGSIRWFDLWWARKQEIFEKEKIVAPQRSKTNTFGYNECEWYASADVYFITEPKNEYYLKYILSLLNSNLYYIWLYNKGKRKGESLELYQKPLSEIPIKKADEQTQNKFVSVVDKILAITQTEDYLQNEEKQNAVKEYEKQIDIMVYKLYDLTYTEVLIIDKDFTLTEQQYNDYQL